MDIILSLVPIIIILVGIIVLNKPASLVAPIAFVVTFIIGMFYFGVGIDVLGKNAWTGVVSGTKVSLWQATGDISQEWYVDWTSYGQYNRTAVLRSNQNKSLALNANRSAVGTICDMLPSNGNIYNDYNVTLEGDHSVSPTQVKLRLPARYNHTSPVFVTTHGIGNYCTWNYTGVNQTWYMADGPSKQK